MTNSLVCSDIGGPVGVSAPGYMRISLNPFQPLLAEMSLANIAHSAPSKASRKKMPGSARSNPTKAPGDLWAISRLTATPAATPTQAALIQRIGFIEGYREE